MDVKQYFRKLREIESGMVEEFPLVVSLETPDGGKPGVMTETPRHLAAKMLLEGRGRLGTDQEKASFREQHAANRKAAEKAEMARRVQVAILADPEMRASITRKGGDTPNGK